MARDVVIWGATLLAAASAGCAGPAEGGGPDPLAVACGGERPDEMLDSCTRGLFRADCGGEGEPVLACSGAFMRYENDYSPDYPLGCESAHTPDVVLSGTAVLSSLEPGADLHGRIALTLATGGTITARF